MNRVYRCFLWGAVLSVVLGIGWLGFAIRDASRAAQASADQCPFNQIMLALHNYHSDYGALPPAYIADDQGRPMHSWRVLILPYCDSRELYERYDFEEPWDGPHNSQLAKLTPGVFGCCHDQPPGMTHIMAITGPGTAFPGSQSVRFSEITDGVKNTMILVEVPGSTIPWLAPVDLPATEAIQRWNAPQQTGLGSVPWRRPYITFGDTLATYSVSQNMRGNMIQALMTRAGGEAVTRDQLVEQGLLRRGTWID